MCAFFFIFFIPAKIFAQDDVKLSEFMANPDSTNEWVELYNSSSNTVDLMDWYIDDIKNDGGDPKKFSLSIPANAYKTIDLGDRFLNNSGGDDVRLLNTDSVEIDKHTYSKTEKGKTWSLVDNVWCITNESFEQANNACLYPTPTPTILPDLPTNTPPSNNIDYNLSLNELLPDPDDDSAIKPNGEWVEIYNPDKIDLIGFKLKDNANNTLTISNDNSETYDRGLFWVVYAGGCGLSLNNNGDTIYLSSNNESLIDSMDYNDSQENKSWSRVDSDWCITEPSKGSGNSGCWHEASESEPNATPTPTVFAANTPFPTPTLKKSKILGATESAEASRSASSSAFFDLWLASGSSQEASSASEKKSFIGAIPWIIMSTALLMFGASGGIYYWQKKKRKI